MWCNWDVDELKARASEIEQSSVLNIGLNGWPFEYGAQPDMTQSDGQIMYKSQK